MNALLTPDEVAAIVGVHVYTVRKWCRDGQLGHVKIGRLTRIPVEALQALMLSPATLEEAAALAAGGVGRE